MRDHGDGSARDVAAGLMSLLSRHHPTDRSKPPKRSTKVESHEVRQGIVGMIEGWSHESGDCQSVRVTRGMTVLKISNMVQG